MESNDTLLLYSSSVVRYLNKVLLFQITFRFRFNLFCIIACLSNIKTGFNLKGWDNNTKKCRSLDLAISAYHGEVGSHKVEFRYFVTVLKYIFHVSVLYLSILFDNFLLLLPTFKQTKNICTQKYLYILLLMALTQHSDTFYNCFNFATTATGN